MNSYEKLYTILSEAEGESPRLDPEALTKSKSWHAKERRDRRLKAVKFGKGQRIFRHPVGSYKPKKKVAERSIYDLEPSNPPSVTVGGKLPPHVIKRIEKAKEKPRPKKKTKTVTIKSRGSAKKKKSSTTFDAFSRKWAAHVGISDSVHKEQERPMKSYERIYNLLTEISDEDLAHYKGRPSRRVKKPSRVTRASKKTQAAENRAKKKEAEGSTKKFTKGTYKQQRGK